MRLTELDPNWVVGTYWGDLGNGQIGECAPNVPVVRRGMGLRFQCPVHRDHRLVVWFANPVDGMVVDGTPFHPGAHYRWQRTGETFEDLTLAPSIDASGAVHSVDGHIETPCWHGYIKNGEVS